MNAVVRFDRDNVLHAGNTCIELPAAYFVRAVDLAQRVSFGRGSKYDARGLGVMAASEQHPAVRELCDWWNLQAPAVVRSAGFFMPWVRVADDGKYHCGNSDIPAQPMGDFSPRTAGQARIRDFVLVEFFKGARDFVFHATSTEVLSVMGGVATEISARRAQIESGDFDEAWYTLDALASFPDRFPEAWEQLMQMTGDVWGAWKQEIQGRRRVALPWGA